MFDTARIIDDMSENELNGYLKEIIKPNTQKEIFMRKKRKAFYYIQESIRIKVPHFVEMITNSEYRKFYKQIKKESQKVKE